jgi:ubiquitin C-terminal hydrolase
LKSKYLGIESNELHKTHSNVERTPLQKQIEDVMFKIWINQKSLIPKGLIKTLCISSIGKQMSIQTSNDLHEFLNLFIDELVTCYAKHEYNLIDTFIGKEIKTFTCSHCNRASYKEETFTSIMVSLPEELVTIMDVNKNVKRGAILTNMIKNNYTDILIRNRECDFCQNKCNGICKVRISKFPKILTIMIRRNDLQGNRLNAYIDTRNNIDLSQLHQDSNLNNASSPIMYTIRSIACHYGSVQTGHYYTIARHPITQQWYEIDDEQVKPINIENVPPSYEFYVLFYENITHNSHSPQKSDSSQKTVINI